MTKKSLILAGLILLGAGCTKQTQAFSFGDLVPAYVVNLIETTEITELKEQKAEQEEKLADIDDQIWQNTCILAEMRDIQQHLRAPSIFNRLCSIFSGPSKDCVDGWQCVCVDIKKNEQELATLTTDKQNAETELNSINQQLEQLTGKK